MLDIHSTLYILTSLTNDLSSDWPGFPLDESSLLTPLIAVVCVCVFGLVLLGLLTCDVVCLLSTSKLWSYFTFQLHGFLV